MGCPAPAMIPVLSTPNKVYPDLSARLRASARRLVPVHALLCCALAVQACDPADVERDPYASPADVADVADQLASVEARLAEVEEGLATCEADQADQLDALADALNLADTALSNAVAAQERITELEAELDELREEQTAQGSRLEIVEIAVDTLMGVLGGA